MPARSRRNFHAALDHSDSRRRAMQALKAQEDWESVVAVTGGGGGGGNPMGGGPGGPEAGRITVAMVDFQDRQRDVFETLGEILVRTRKLTRIQLEEMLQEHPAPDRPRRHTPRRTDGVRGGRSGGRWTPVRRARR